jgi:hypothetical protein
VLDGYSPGLHRLGTHGADLWRRTPPVGLLDQHDRVNVGDLSQWDGAANDFEAV